MDVSVAVRRAVGRRREGRLTTNALTTTGDARRLTRAEAEAAWAPHIARLRGLCTRAVRRARTTAAAAQTTEAAAVRRAAVQLSCFVGCFRLRDNAMHSFTTRTHMHANIHPHRRRRSQQQQGGGKGPCSCSTMWNWSGAGPTFPAS